jgi:hypothetical protein
MIQSIYLASEGTAAVFGAAGVFAAIKAVVFFSMSHKLARRSKTPLRRVGTHQYKAMKV